MNNLLSNVLKSPVGRKLLSERDENTVEETHKISKSILVGRKLLSERDENTGTFPVSTLNP